MEDANQTKVDLKTLTPLQLRNMVRHLRKDSKEQRARTLALIEDNEELESTAVALREQVTQQQEEIERLTAANEELQQKFEQATDNNTALRALIDTAGRGNGEVFNDARIVSRLDILTKTVSAGLSLLLGTNLSDDEADPSEDAEVVPYLPLRTRETMEDADPEDDDGDDEESDEDDVNIDDVEDDASEDETEESSGDTTAVTMTGDAVVAVPPANNQVEGIHGATVTAPVPAGEADLTASVIEPITGFINMMGDDFETQIRAPIRAGEVNKELALRNIVGAVWGTEEGTKLAESILNSNSTRDAVYEAMGI
jgi:hypothetical protein